MTKPWGTAVATGVWITTSQRRAAQGEAVRQFVQSLCADLAAGGEPTSVTTRAGQSIVGKAAVTELRALLIAGPDAMNRLAIDVTPGDNSDFGDTPPRATHTVTIRLDQTQRLGLRIMHPGRAREITIIGYWTPQ